MTDDDRIERALKTVGDSYVRENPPNFPAFREAVLRRRRRRAWIQGGAALAFAGAAVALGLFFTRATTPVTGGTLPPADADAFVTETVRVGVSPSQINVGRKAIWVTSRLPGTLSRISPTSPHDVTSVPLEGVPNDLAVGGAGVWIANAGNLQHVSLQGKGFPTEYPVASPGATMHVAVSPGAVWVVVARDAVFRVDPANPRDMTEVPVTDNPVDIAVGDGVLWVLDLTGEIQAFDAKTGDRIGASINVPTGRDAEITLGAGALWYGVAGTTTLGRIDTATREQSRITLPSDYVDLGVGPDEVYVLMSAGAQRGSIAPLDTSTGEVVHDDIHSFSGDPVDVAVGRQALWIINKTGARAQRVDKEGLFR